jgi:hypothetical protein
LKIIYFIFNLFQSKTSPSLAPLGLGMANVGRRLGMANHMGLQLVVMGLKEGR